MPSSSVILLWLAVLGLAAILTYGAIACFIGWLRTHVVAIPTARSSHSTPRPQGGGIIVIPVAMIGAAGAWMLDGSIPPGGHSYFAVIGALALGLALIGLVDDVSNLPVAPRLAAQAIAVAIAVLLLPTDARILPASVPIALERGMTIAAGLWFINLFNFMDGIDWISGTATIAITAGVAALAFLGTVPATYGYIAVALLGATLGFMPWNAPPARLFLGDAGSLPLGFLLGVLLLHVAVSGAVAAAAILPLYYLGDATTTLLRRAWRGEKLWQAHHSHFYQIAIRSGFSVRETLGRIALANAALAVIAVASTRYGNAFAVACTVLAGLIVAALLFVLAKGR